MEVEQTFEQFIQNIKKPLSISDFKELVSNYTVIDTRPFAESTGLIKGSYWFPSQNLLSSFLPSLMDSSVSYLLVCERQAVNDLLENFVLLGYMNCMGYNNFDMKKYDGQLEYPVIRRWNQLGDSQKKQFLDVRTPMEWNQTGVIKGAVLIELKKLDQDNEQKLELLKQISGKKLIVTHCRQGNRSKVALSILFRHGISAVGLSESVEDFSELGLSMITVKENEQYWKKKLENGLEYSEQEDENKAQRQLQTDNCNRMQIEQCYEECLRNHPEKSQEQCRRQCEERKRRNQQQTSKMQHSENKNQFQASKMRITPSKLSQQETHLQNLNQQVIEQQTSSSQISRVFQNISEHNYSAASDLLTQLIAKNPQNSNLYINRAMCHIQLNQEKQAINDLNEAIEKDHLNFIPYFDLASYKLNSSQTKQNKLAALENLLCSLSCMYLRRGLKSRSNNDFQKAIQCSPTNLQALAFLSLKMLQNADFVGCLNYLEKMNKLTQRKNQLILKMIQKVQKRMQSQQKSDNPESSKQLIEGKTSQQQEKLIIEHFGSSQFGKRLVGKSISFSDDQEINKQIERRVKEWNDLYCQIIKEGSLELRRVDQMECGISSTKSDKNQRTVWIME